MADIKLEISEKEIKSMSEHQFKKIVKQKVEQLALVNLKASKKQKSMNLNMESFKPKEYMLSKNLSISEVQILYKIRNSMIDFKENFKSNQENLWCRLCFLFCESQQHLFENLNINMAYQSLKQQVALELL